MKKGKIFLLIGLILVVGIISFILFNNRTTSIITLDINPSIEIHLNKNKKIKKVIPLNEDAKEIVNIKLNGIKLEEALDIIVDNLVQNDYYDEDNRTMEIFMHVEGNVTNEDVLVSIRHSFEQSDVAPIITVIENITKEDEKLAKKYNITPAKASYINSIVNNNGALTADELIEKPIQELSETKETGKYCESDYSLEGDFCFKEIGREEAISGRVCPRGYHEYNGSCYQQKGFLETGEYYCDNEFTLDGTKCVRTFTINATGSYKCDKGKLIKRGEAYRTYRDAGDYEEMTCADESNGQKPVYRCYAQEHIVVNGQCGMGPKPTINGGCLNGDRLVNGGCYDFAPRNEWVCPSTGIYETEDMICPETIVYTKATLLGYSCEDDYELQGDKCVKYEEIDAFKKMECEQGSTLIDNDKCLVLNSKTELTDGYKCEKENTKIFGTTCVIYDIVEARQN